MYNTAYRIVGNAAEAEDIMQESFLTAFQKVHDFKGDSTFGAWLKRIVVNKAIDQVKRQKETIALKEEQFSGIQDDSTENYLEMLSYKIDQIRRGIEALHDEDRIIISLFLLEGYDHDEISQILNITYGASRTRYSRARQKLRDLLKKQTINQLVN